MGTSSHLFFLFWLSFLAFSGFQALPPLVCPYNRHHCSPQTRPAVQVKRAQSASQPKKAGGAFQAARGRKHSWHAENVFLREQMWSTNSTNAGLYLPAQRPAQQPPWVLQLQLRQVLVALPTCRGRTLFEFLLEMVPLRSPTKALLPPPATTSDARETLSRDDAARSEIQHIIPCWKKCQECLA